MPQTIHYFTVICRLSDGETWVQMTDMQTREPLEFETEQLARYWLDSNYPHKLQGVNHRVDAFHGLQPLRVARVNRRQGVQRGKGGRLYWTDRMPAAELLALPVECYK